MSLVWVSKEPKQTGCGLGDGVLCDDPGDSLGKTLRHLMKILR